MKILLVTGRVAAPLIHKIVKNITQVDMKVLELPIPVAAMMTSEYLLRELPRYKEHVDWSDIIIVPGMTKGDLAEVSKRLGKPVYKGCLYADDIPFMIEYLMNGGELSTLNPLDELVSENKRMSEKEILDRLRKEAENSQTRIGGKPLTSRFPLIAGEIFLNEHDNVEDVLFSIKRYLSEGADIIVLGTSRLTLEQLLDVSKSIRKKLDVPLGVDFPRQEEIASLQDGEFDILLSFTPEFLQKSLFKQPFEKTAIVIIPDHNTISADEKVISLKKGLEEGLRQGHKKIILDPVLYPPMKGFVESVYAYIQVKKHFPDVPMLMGVSNYVELIDADSIGVNAVLATIGVEIGVELFLLTEASVKTSNSIREFKTAIEMALLAREKGRYPKDFTLNLLVCKDKRRRGVRPKDVQNAAVASRRVPHTADPAGYFKIYVDHAGKSIIVEHYYHGSMVPNLSIIGDDPSLIIGEILQRKLATKPEHFYYLGRELCKAEIALKLGKDYVQDSDLFPDREPI